MLNLTDIIKAPSLASLAAALVAAKEAEEAARQHRVAIEEAIVRALPAKDEGTSRATDDGYKVAVTWKLNRKVDADRLKDDWHVMPAAVQAAFAWKPEVAMSHLRALEKAAPLDYAEALHYIVTTPAKPSVAVEVAK